MMFCIQYKGPMNYHYYELPILFLGVPVNNKPYFAPKPSSYN